MSETAATHASHEHHQELGFFRTYIFSLDHKMIGRQFLFMGLLMIIVGGLLAMLVRWELAWPETAVPGLGFIPEPYIYPGEHGGGIIPPQTYNALFTMHATIMIFFVVMPIMVGTFGNFLIPLMIGTRDMAFPKLNMLSFWVGAIATCVMLSSFFVPGGPAAGGWTSYAPLSARAQYTGVEWGQNLWIISLLILGVSSLMGSINYITTIINMRAPGMTYFRMPLTVWSLFVTAILLLLALPVLTAALAMLLLVGIAFLGWIVWGHHMFQSGMNPTLGTSFMISTMVIAVPSAIKTFNWLGTLWGGDIHFKVPMMFALGFVAMFVIGGLSGIFMASTPVDIFIHDTYFIVGHIHYVLFGGSLFGAFAGLYYWYPKMFGRMMSETWGKVHWALTFLTFNLVFFPMHFLGMRGMQRRIYDYSQYTHLKGLQPMNQFMTISLFVLGAAQVILVLNFFLSMRRGKPAGA